MCFNETYEFVPVCRDYMAMSHPESLNFSHLNLIIVQFCDGLCYIVLRDYGFMLL